MNRNFTRSILWIVGMLVAICLDGTAAGRTLDRPAGEHAAVLDLADLRSAYLLRAGHVAYDPLDASVGGLRRQLQRHFDTVLGLLIASTPTSLDVAVQRLEAARGETWSEAERAYWRERLLQNRLVQLGRLEAYRDRGRFPLNEVQAAHAVPIFVDRHDTACAVGHLMRLSGSEEAVEEIRAANNLVYVPDAEDGQLAAWILASGLTIEEAALIQPAYGWPGPGGPGIPIFPIDPGVPVDLIPPGSTFLGEHDAGDYEPGEQVLERHGLRLKNFEAEKVSTQSGGLSVSFQPVDGLGLLSGVGEYVGPQIAREHHEPVGTHWLAIGVPNGGAGDGISIGPSLHSLGGYAPRGMTQRIRVRFDVSTVADNARIDSITQTSSGALRGFSTLLGDTSPAYSMTTRVLAGQDEVAVAHFDQSVAGDALSPLLKSTAVFGPQTELTVETEIWLENGASLRTYLLDFNVVQVPEPSTAALLLVSLGSCFCVVRVCGRRCRK